MEDETIPSLPAACCRGEQKKTLWHGERETDRERETERERQRDSERERQRETERQRQKADDH